MAALIFVLVKLIINVEGALAKHSKLLLDSQTALFWIINRGEWQPEYLSALRESHENKTAGEGRLPNEGDVVVVHEDGVKRDLWKR